MSLTFLLQQPINFERQVYVIDATFMAEPNPVSVVCTLTCISLLISTHCKQRLLRDTFIYGYNDKALGVSLIPYTFNKTVNNAHNVLLFIF